MRSLLPLALVACASTAPDDPGAGGGGAWSVEVDELPGALLSVAGAPDDLWAVGGGLGNGTGAIALHGDGGSWSREDPGIADTLWWAWRAGSDDVFAVGENGAIVRRRGGSWEEAPRLTTATLYGVWGSGPEDVWAVGGSPRGDGPDDVVLHFDGESWTQVEVPAPRGVVLFKVWGSGPGDVWIVGERGGVLHASGGALAWSEAVDASGALPVRLVTVSGSGPDDVWAVGGPDPGSGVLRTMVFRLDPGRSVFALESAPGAGAIVNGVSAAGEGAVFAVGFGGLRLRRERGGRWRDDSGAEPRRDLHAVHALPGGGAVAAGGDFAALPSPGDRVRGWLLRYEP